MNSLKLFATLCLLVVAEGADVATLATACTVGTDTCTVANSECSDRDVDGDTTCECISTYYSDGGSPAACVLATTLGSTCSAQTCGAGTTCKDTNGDGTIDTCLCSIGYHASGSSCVTSAGSACTTNGIACTSWATCSVADGGSSVATTCLCNSGYFSDGANCNSGSDDVAPVSLVFLLTAFVLQSLLR